MTSLGTRTHRVYRINEYVSLRIVEGRCLLRAGGPWLGRIGSVQISGARDGVGDANFDVGQGVIPCKQTASPET